LKIPSQLQKNRTECGNKYNLFEPSTGLFVYQNFIDTYAKDNFSHRRGSSLIFHREAHPRLWGLQSPQLLFFSL
jgi:hypothetical protein